MASNPRAMDRNHHERAKVTRTWTSTKPQWATRNNDKQGFSVVQKRLSVIMGATRDEANAQAKCAFVSCLPHENEGCCGSTQGSNKTARTRGSKMKKVWFGLAGNSSKCKAREAIRKQMDFVLLCASWHLRVEQTAFALGTKGNRHKSQSKERQA